MESPHCLTLEKQGPLLFIGLNRPQKMNAFNLQMLRELAEAYGTYEVDANLRCAVLFAHGDHFTAGLDLAEVGPAVAAGEDLFPPSRVDPLALFGASRTKPVVIAVHGWCLTIGLELLLASDIAVAAEETRFRQMEVNRGIMPFGGATLRLPRQVGWGNAMRWLLTGDTLDASEAHRIGLVQELTPTGHQRDRATAIAETIACRAPLAVRATRASAVLASERGPEAALKPLMDKTRELMKTEDAQEGVASFVERREAVFRGR